MKNKFLVFLNLLICIFSYSQTTFWKNYNNGGYNLAYRLIQSNDKGYLVLGASAPDASQSLQMYLLKTDSIGNKIWTKTYDNGLGASITKTFDGGYILLNSNGYPVVKLDSAGNTEWTKDLFYYQKKYCFQSAIVQTDDSNYVIAGTIDYQSNFHQIYLLKLNSRGDSIWSKTYKDTSSIAVNEMKKTIDGGFIMVGYAYSKIISRNVMYVIKTNSKGDTSWTRKYVRGTAISVCQTSDSNYVVSGYDNETILIKINSSGNIIWNKKFNISYGEAIIETSDKGLFLIGDNFRYFKTDSKGNILWENKAGIKIGVGWAQDCIQSSDNGFVITGFFYHNPVYPRDNILLVKTDANGCVPISIMNISGNNKANLDSINSYKATLNYGSDTLNYHWSSKYGQILYGQGTDSINVSWNNEGTDTLQLVVSNDCNKDSLYYAIKISKWIDPFSNPFIFSNPINRGSENPLLSVRSIWYGVKESEYSNNMLIYPNPAADELSIHSSSFYNEALTVSIMNVLGQETSPPTHLQIEMGEATIDVSKLKAGIYFLQLKSEKGCVVKRFVKE